jgi:choice-of-anchor A domain-containing protein
MKHGISTIALAAGAAWLFLLPAGAGAATLSATQLIDTYNAVIFGNLTSTSEMDGNALVGGAVSGGNYATHSGSGIPTAPDALTAGGNLTGNVNINGSGLAVGGNIATSNLNLNKGGNVVVGGNVASGFNANFNGNGSLYVVGSATNHSSVSVNGGSAYLGGTVQSGSQINVNGGQLHQNSGVPATMLPNIAGQVATAQSELKAYSVQLAGLAQNSSVSSSNGTLTFNAAPNAKGLAVFDIASNAASLLGSATQYAFDLNGAKEIVINVSGVGSTQLNLSANFLGGIAATLGTDTVWNFTDATNIDVKAQFGGTILADYANITNSGNIEGTVVANSVTQNAEFHYDGQNANLVSPVPLPASLPLFGAALIGVVGLGFGQTRRRANRA